jgi:hypothetical protein
MHAWPDRVARLWLLRHADPPLRRHLWLGALVGLYGLATVHARHRRHRGLRWLLVAHVRHGLPLAHGVYGLYVHREQPLRRDLSGGLSPKRAPLRLLLRLWLHDVQLDDVYAQLRRELQPVRDPVPGRLSHRLVAL